MLYESEASKTALSMTDPVGAAMYLTPDLAALWTLSGNGKKASDDKDTSVSLSSHSCFSSAVSGVGISANLDSYSLFSGSEVGIWPVTKTGAVDSGLLSGTQTDHHTVLGVADRVGLGVFQSDGSHSQIDGSLLGQVGVLGNELLERRRVDDGVVSLLLQSDSVNLSGLCRLWCVIRIDLQNTVLSTLLFLENLKGGWLVAWSNHTVTDFFGDDRGGWHIDNVGKSNKVTERRHSVGTSGSGVGIGQWGKVFDVVDKGIEQVDVTWRSAQHLERKLTIRDISLSWLLVRISTVSQWELRDTLRVLLSEEVGDGTVVVCGVFKSLQSEDLSGLVGNVTFSGQFLQEMRVVLRIGQDGHSGVVLGGSSEQGDTTNVNFFDSLFDGDIDFSNRLLEWVQVANNKVDLFDVLLGEIVFIGLDVSCQNTTVNGWVQSLDTAAQHFWSVGDGGNIFHREPRFPQKSGCSARGKQPNVCGNKSLGKIQETCLVRQGVVLLPSVSSSLLGLVEQVTLLDTSGLLSNSSKTSGFSVLVDRVGDPVVSSVSSDGLVLWVNTNDLVVLVGRVLVDPVRVQDSQVSSLSTNSLLGSGSQRLLVLQLVDTLVGWLTVSSTLWNRSLSATSSDSDSEDGETLLGLVTKSSSLVWSRWSGSSVDHRLLSVLPASDSEKESHDIRLLLSLQLFKVLVGSHGAKQTANDAQKKLNKSKDQLEKDLDSSAKDAKSKIDDLSSNISKRVDEFKDDLPEKEAKIKNYFKKVYNSVVGTTSSFYTSSVETVKNNPITSSQLLLALVGTAGAVITLSQDPTTFDRWISKRENRFLLSGIATTVAVLDGLFISYVKQKN
ncbi:hypothetical protein OGAPHI_004120 [Ogataea philodendri]|uniref:Uncharacterized protein n=1 Tax=Ogataea philodendri TaxID=1378263 RepID=A0A9P8T5H3_9ASCO|nr:uncharacterized protein OGAPHI_004120 [Ogataea philodendri]KAH3665931.1 hypothetical protein OGAPHI_004120 [Ogataea philodendri]